MTRVLLFPALFIDVEADFHARVPVVICKDKDRLEKYYGLDNMQIHPSLCQIMCGLELL